jgi:ketosteroid isomerase-like protein
MNVCCKPSHTLKIAGTLLLLFTLIFTCLGCHKETEQDRVKKVILTIQKAAEEKDIKKVINNLSMTYSDPQGYDYDSIKGLLLGYFFRHQKIHVAITDLEVSTGGSVAKAVFQAILTGGDKTGSVADLIPDVLGIYAFVVELRKEPDGWKVTSATWERVGEGGTKGER